jgi:precorrin-2 dehydrogenase/sirohydrochlorin ferrochelatase
MMNEKPLYPAFLKLAGRPVLVVGAGDVGRRKIERLLRCGASVHVVGESAHPEVEKWAAEGALTLSQRAFEPGDLDGVRLAVAATNREDVNERIAQLARERGVLLNAVDDPARCDFYVPSVLARGDLQVAVSSGGRCPALVVRVRKELEKTLGPEYGRFLEDLARVREALRRAFPDDAEKRRRLLGEMANSDAPEALADGDEETYRERLDAWKSRPGD